MSTGRRRFLIAMALVFAVGGCAFRLVIPRYEVVGRYVIDRDWTESPHRFGPRFVQLNANGEIEPGSTVLALHGQPYTVQGGFWKREGNGVEVETPHMRAELQRWYFLVSRKYVIFGPIMLSDGFDSRPTIWFRKE